MALYGEFQISPLEGHLTRVYENPTHEEFLSALRRGRSKRNARGMVSDSGDVYLWDGGEVHNDVKRKLKIWGYSFDVNTLPNGSFVVMRAAGQGPLPTEIRNARMLKRMLGESMAGPFEKMVERQFEKLPDNFGWGRSKQVYLNPTDDEFRKFAIGRGMVSKDGVVYYWDNNAATHEMMERYLKVQNRVAFYASYKPGTPGPAAGLRLNIADYTSTVLGDAAVAILQDNKVIQAAKPDMITVNEVGWGKETEPGAKTFKRWDGDARAWITVDAEGNPV